MRYWITTIAVATLVQANASWADDEHSSTATADASQVSAATLIEISRNDFSKRWGQEHSNLTLVDVRSAEEFAAGHVPGAINIPLDQLPNRASELKSDDEIVVYCWSGVRAAQAIEFLRGREYKHVEHLTGDFSEWQASGATQEKSVP